MLKKEVVMKKKSHITTKKEKKIKKIIEKNRKHEETRLKEKGNKARLLDTFVKKGGKIKQIKRVDW
jgi:ribosomal protein L15E